MARLMLQPTDGLQRPFFYLLDVYARCSKELRSTDAYKDKTLAQQLQAVILQTQELALSHANLVLTMDLFPKVGLQEKICAFIGKSEPSSLRSGYVKRHIAIKTTNASLEAVMRNIDCTFVAIYFEQ